MLPTTAELPAGWKRTDSKSVGWRDAATSEEFAKYLPCSATAQESAERHGYGSIVFDAPGNGGDGIDLTLSVPRSPGPLDGPAPKAEAASLVEENLTLYRKLYDCYNPKNAGIGDSSIVFTTERFTHIIMRVGPVEVAYSPTKSVSENSSPGSSRIRIARLPFGNAARATGPSPQEPRTPSIFRAGSDTETLPEHHVGLHNHNGS
ncbi:hypothetical protein [Streptomyces sp. NBC_01767]|uniref:hypothetical protein n=1 Tax=Streptomyces sp. NBC_01767 TaxID=2975937 RepID=UPI00225384C1|nr:hypothetical protein [Streptomyces sp. NBC_01767]MCX4399177.1 hypothetical protein [Streptomyces sp. NBC_01767]